MTSWLSRWIPGIKADETVSAVEFRWGASWAQGHTFLVLLLCLLAVAVAVAYYLLFQTTTRTRLRVLGIGARALGLVLLVGVVAQPVLQVTLVERLRPLLLLVFDGSDSMNLPATNGDDTGKPPRTRMERVQETLEGHSETLAELSRHYRLKAYLSGDDGALQDLPLTSGEQSDGEGIVDAEYLASQLRADAEVTSLGTSLEEVRRRHRGRHLQRLVMFSDFNVNSGKPVLAEASRLTAHIDTVGVGPRQVVDASVSLRCDLVIKKDEERRVNVEVRQTGLDGGAAQLQLFARNLDGAIGGGSARAIPVGEPRLVKFDKQRIVLDIPYRPTEVGRVRLEARLEVLGEEALGENNVAARDVMVRDEAIKLLFVEYEPTWEWRFVKEVFHRDRLVGRDGFRTYLHSADFGVRRSDRMFLTSLDQSRADFFANDVIFLSDVPNDLLSRGFQDRLIEYVRDFGGGLVVITGPRFGAKALAQTKIADMLPVVLNETQGPRVDWFRLQLTPSAAAEDFMNLADPKEDNAEAWKNLGQLPWYQPVARLHPQGIALASHPRDRCIDGTTPQPIIATRRFGRGEVVYLGFNEMWRLRRIHDEKYYRRFWGQLMYRLGLSHALGSQKRFKVTTDRDTYQVGNQMTVKVEAYDEDFQPLEVERLAGRLRLVADDEESPATEIPITTTGNQAEFEATVPLFVEGVHRLLVDDPVAKKTVEIVFNVEPVSIERRTAVRNVELQQELARQTGGRAFELQELAGLAEDVDVTPIEETTYRYIPLWNTWLTVIAVISLFLTEWTVRKFADLT